MVTYDYLGLLYMGSAHCIMSSCLAGRLFSLVAALATRRRASGSYRPLPDQSCPVSEILGFSAEVLPIQGQVIWQEQANLYLSPEKRRRHPLPAQRNML